MRLSGRPKSLVQVAQKKKATCMHPQGTPDSVFRLGHCFATQFWDRKEHPTKVSQPEFLATRIDVDLEQKVMHAGRQRYA